MILDMLTRAAHRSFPPAFKIFKEIWIGFFTVLLFVRITGSRHRMEAIANAIAIR